MTVIASTIGTATEQGHSLWASLGLTPTDELASKGGVIAGLELTKTAGMGWRIGLGRGAIQRTSAVGLGVVPFAVTATETGTFENGDALKARIDTIYAVVVPAAGQTPATVAIRVATGVLPGQGSPVAPGLPADALRLFDVPIAAGTSAGSGGWVPGDAIDRRTAATLRADITDVQLTYRRSSRLALEQITTARDGETAVVAGATVTEENGTYTRRGGVWWIDDTGLLTVPANWFTTGFAPDAAGVRYRRVGALVQVVGVVNKNPGNRTGTAFTLPPGFRPDFRWSGLGQASGIVRNEIIVDTSGNFVVSFSSSDSNGIAFAAMFMVAFPAG